MHVYDYSKYVCKPIAFAGLVESIIANYYLAYEKSCSSDCFRSKQVIFELTSHGHSSRISCNSGKFVLFLMIIFLFVKNNNDNK